jgi:hypothetical protein
MRDGLKGCELVLFMLMPRPGCEGNHAGILAVVTILGQLVYEDFEARTVERAEVARTGFQ